MKIALAQQNYHIGNFENNISKIIKGIEEAKVQHADIVVFSELCVCGYPPRDFVEFNDFINKCYAGIDIIKEHADTIAVIVGSPARNPIKEGKDLFNAAFFLYGKRNKSLRYIKHVYQLMMCLMNIVISNQRMIGGLLNSKANI
jgi:NAD+ synthase (glutamine-hydrolysing)